jgi:hypothetical protein
VQGQVSQRAICGAITAHKNENKNVLGITGATGTSFDALKCAQQQRIGWIEDHRLLYDL